MTADWQPWRAGTRQSGEIRGRQLKDWSQCVVQRKRSFTEGPHSQFILPEAAAGGPIVDTRSRAGLSRLRRPGIDDRPTRGEPDVVAVGEIT